MLLPHVNKSFEQNMFDFYIILELWFLHSQERLICVAEECGRRGEMIKILWKFKKQS